MEIIISPVSGIINEIISSLHYLLKKGRDFHRETEALRMCLASSQKVVTYGSAEYCGDHVMVSGGMTDTELCALMVKGQARKKGPEA